MIFKVGDKVRIKKGSEGFDGQEGEINGIMKESRYPYMVKLSKIGESIMFDGNELELINEGKIFIFRK